MNKNELRKVSRKKSIKTYAFVDASNLFYGGEKSLGWKIDYRKLLRYLKRKYRVSKVFYYAGVELDGFEYSILGPKPIDLNKLIAFHNKKLSSRLSESKTLIIQKCIQRLKFYRKLEQFGYILRLKQTKIFLNEGKLVKKANCDVDLTFDMMCYINEYDGVVLLSGDGDFAILVKHLKKIGKSITILARAERTAKELRILAGKDFRDFHYLRELLRL